MKIGCKIKRTLFLGLVYNTALSGLEAYHILPRHTRRLDTARLRLLRSLMAGWATTLPEHSEHLVTMTNDQLWKYWGIVDTFTELKV